MKRDIIGRFAHVGFIRRVIYKVRAFYFAVVRILKVVWLWTKIGTAVGAVASLLIFSGFVAGISHSANADTTPMVAGKTDAPEDNVVKAAVLKGELLEIIRKHETLNTTIQTGEIFSSFDPNSKMKAACMVIGGKRPLDCESYGIYQEKIGTVIAYAPQLYGHSVTQLEAMTIANDEEKASDFLLQCAIKVPGCIWNWTSANNNHAVVEDLINKIRVLEQ